MKKSLITLSILATMSNAQAGSMGPITSEQPNYTPFLSGEGSYTWNGFNSSKMGATITPAPWGGRIAAGINRSWRGNWGLSLETGYGYYGSVHNIHPLSGGGDWVNATINVDSTKDILGGDILVGLSFTHNQFDLFAKVGMMVETVWITGTHNANLNLFNVINVSDNLTFKATQAAVLPEIKVGGDYNINKAVGISLAYMHVFGSSHQGPSASVSVPSGALSPITGTINNLPVKLDAILLGVHYNFT